MRYGILRFAALAVVLSCLAGCSWKPWWEREPLPEFMVEPLMLPLDVLSIVMLEQNNLQITMIVDDRELEVGDTFHWMAKLDNPTLKPITVRFAAMDPAQLLRFDQDPPLLDPITNKAVLRMRAGIRAVGQDVERTLPEKMVIEPLTPQVLEGTGEVVKGEGSRIIIRFEEVEVVLPYAASYVVYLPVLVELGDRYTLGAIDSIREEFTSSVERITVR